MLMLGRMLTLVMGLLGGAFFSQAPEFAQQYRQRIGGALDELRAVITRFDTAATDNGLDRGQALDLYSASPQSFLRSQGDAMRYSFRRYESLEQQRQELAQASPLAKPFVILRNPDPDLVRNAWTDFSPGVPLTFAGLAWAGIGLILGWLASALMGTASLRAARRRRRGDHSLPRRLRHERVMEADAPPQALPDRAPDADLRMAELPEGRPRQQTV